MNGMDMVAEDRGKIKSELLNMASNKDPCDVAVVDFASVISSLSHSLHSQPPNLL